MVKHRSNLLNEKITFVHPKPVSHIAGVKCKLSDDKWIWLGMVPSFSYFIFRNSRGCQSNTSMNESFGEKRGTLRGKEDKRGKWGMCWGGAFSVPAESESYLALMSKRNLLGIFHPPTDVLVNPLGFRFQSICSNYIPTRKKTFLRQALRDLWSAGFLHRGSKFITLQE